MEPQRFEGVTPILRVTDLGVSLDWYTRTLEFAVEWREPWFACVVRDRARLFLSQGDQGKPGAWVWIGVSDVEALHEKIREAGAAIRNPPQNFPWAMEMQIQDPDGNVLRLGSEPKPDMPWGEWLDMEGVRWAKDGEGWKRVTP